MKGGSGKTTLASCLAGHWSKIGKRVSYIDGDPSQTVWRLSRLGHCFHEIEFETADQNLLINHWLKSAFQNCCLTL